MKVPKTKGTFIMSKYLDRAGNRYGKLIAIKIDKEKTDSIPKEKRQGAYWICQCDCGNVVSVRGNILGKNTTSCGCSKKEQDQKNLGRFIHGKSHSRLATIWYHMNGRCHNPKDYNYHRYGAKGIEVCNEWKTDFLAFEKWALTHGYKDGLSIDRIDVCGNYEPNNCRWGNFQTQLNNKRDTLWVEYNGELMSLKQAFNLAKPDITYTTARIRYQNGTRDPIELFKKNRRYRGK